MPIHDQHSTTLSYQYVFHIPWWDERRANVSCNLGPVESNGKKRQPSLASEQLVHNRILGSHPSRDSEDTQELSQKPRDEVVEKGTCCYNDKPFVSVHCTSQNTGIWSVVSLIHGIHERNTSKILGPDHRCRIHLKRR